MTRRSVPRGVAVGLFVAVIIPVMHTFIAALLAIPARANVAVAAGGNALFGFTQGDMVIAFGLGE